MHATRINELTIQKQLSAKRNALFEEFLQNPVNVGLVSAIWSIDARIAELTKVTKDLSREELKHD